MSELPPKQWWEWWKRLGLFIIIVIVVLPYIPREPCLPDLRFKYYSWTAVDHYYYVHVSVINDGCAKSGECEVHCNAIDVCPPANVSDIRYQETWILQELQPSETATHSFSFTIPNLLREEVSIIEIEVDAKGIVRESNEDNNYVWFLFDP